MLTAQSLVVLNHKQLLLLIFKIIVIKSPFLSESNFYNYAAVYCLPIVH